MRSNKAFTLIEVMVVLSILAIIAILAYNFFGSTMKEATERSLAVEVHKQATTLASAIEKHYMDTGYYIAGGGTMSNGVAYLMNANILRADVDFPAEANEAGYEAHTWIIKNEVGGADYGGTAAVDVYFQAQHASDTLCAAYNNLVAPDKIGNRVWADAARGGTDPTFTPVGDLITWCHDNGTSNYLMYMLEIR